MMALTSKQAGLETYLLFEEDFYITNEADKNQLKAFHFAGRFKEDGYYLRDLFITENEMVAIDSNTVIHMRIDPPYDARYHRYLWMLDFLSNKTGCRVVNNPIGIMKYNEKLTGYAAENAIESFVGSSHAGFKKFVEALKEKGIKEIIIKPLDLYSGIGVEKFSLDTDLTDIFNEAVSLFKGAIVAQPFVEKIYTGELRSIYLNAQEIGTILKTPPKGQFLANIAQGAQFERIKLEAYTAKICEAISKKLYADGVNLVAFDILGESINEVNVTCPGLMVEVSFASGENLCERYIQIFN